MKRYLKNAIGCSREKWIFDYLLVFPERHLDKIRWTDDIFDDFTASNNSFSRFILLIDLSINKLRFITHGYSSWMNEKKEEKKTEKEIVEQSNPPSCQSKKKEQIRWISYEIDE